MTDRLQKAQSVTQVLLCCTENMWIYSSPTWELDISTNLEINSELMMQLYTD